MAQDSDNSVKTEWKVSDCPLVNPCEQRWEDLHAVPNQARMRHCLRCAQSVYRCDTQAEFREHRALGHCIAIEVQTAEGESVRYLGAAPIASYDPAKQLT